MKVKFVVNIFAPEGYFSWTVGGVFTKDSEMPFCPVVGTTVFLEGFCHGFKVSSIRWVEGKPYTEIHLENPSTEVCYEFLNSVDELRKAGWK